jgi:hypothetical protein
MALTVDQKTAVQKITNTFHLLGTTASFRHKYEELIADFIILNIRQPYLPEELQGIDLNELRDNHKVIWYDYDNLATLSYTQAKNTLLYNALVAFHAIRIDTTRSLADLPFEKYAKVRA